MLTSSSVDLNEGVLSLKNTWSFSYLPYLNNDFSWKGYINCFVLCKEMVEIALFEFMMIA